MIAEIKFKNMFSFRDENVFSFEADKSSEMESYHVVEISPGIRLLKLAVVYGANASGKSNFIGICNFIKNFLLHPPSNKSETTGVMPFLLNKYSNKESSDLSISFYVRKEKELPMKFVYTLSLNEDYVIEETLIYYPSQQPATVFERSIKSGVSTIKFGNKIKLSAAAKEELSLKCLPNMSVIAAYMQVNINIPGIEDALTFFRTCMMSAINPLSNLDQYAENRIKEKETKDYILQYLQEADFNISDISARERKSSAGVFRGTFIQHKVQDPKEKDAYYELPKYLESKGTIRTMGLAGYIQVALTNNAFLAVDEIEASLHPKLIEYIIERFLKESKNAQMLLTTHYDGLLDQEDLLRKDNIWFAEKNNEGASILYPLTDFKGLNKISSLQKAYKFGKFGAVPTI